MLLGYDSMFKQRTNDEESEHLEGVIVAYKRNLFQMFKAIPLELNRAADYEPANIRKQCKTDNVALICFLQPWPRFTICLNQYNNLHNKIPYLSITFGIFFFI